MPRPYPAEFRRRALALVETGRSVSKTAADLDVTEASLYYNWIKQDRIDRGELAGTMTAESRELRKANRRIRELESEVEILRRAHKLLGPEATRPKGST